MRLEVPAMGCPTSDGVVFFLPHVLALLAFFLGLAAAFLVGARSNAGSGAVALRTPSSTAVAPS